MPLPLQLLLRARVLLLPAALLLQPLLQPPLPCRLGAQCWPLCPSLSVLLPLWSLWVFLPHRLRWAPAPLSPLDTRRGCVLRRALPAPLLLAAAAALSVLSAHARRLVLRPLRPRLPPLRWTLQPRRRQRALRAPWLPRGLMPLPLRRTCQCLRLLTTPPLAPMTMPAWRGMGGPQLPLLPPLPLLLPPLAEGPRPPGDSTGGWSPVPPLVREAPPLERRLSRALLTPPG